MDNVAGVRRVFQCIRLMDRYAGLERLQLADVLEEEGFDTAARRCRGGAYIHEVEVLMVAQADDWPPIDYVLGAGASLWTRGPSLDRARSKIAAMARILLSAFPECRLVMVWPASGQSPLRWSRVSSRTSGVLPAVSSACHANSDAVRLRQFWVRPDLPDNYLSWLRFALRPPVVHDDDPR